MANVTLDRPKNLSCRQPSITSTDQEFFVGNTTTRKSTSSLRIYHQNIRSLMSKKEELNVIMKDKSVNSHLICLSEHHLKTQEITKFTLNSYKIAASFCGEEVPKGGVCIMTRHNIQFATIDLFSFCIERIFEICEIEVNSKNKKIIVGCIYRSPSGDIVQFLELLEDTLSYLYKRSGSLILCGDLNINFLLETPNKKRLDILMKSYNLDQIVDFPTRITHNLATLIDGIYLDTM